MQQEIFLKMLDRLPYHLQGGPNINIILKVFSQVLWEFYQIQLQVSSIGDVNSTGILLDKTGELVNELRNGDDDEVYRERIITKIIRNFSKGDVETLNGLGRTLLGSNYIGIFEKWNYETEKQEAALALVYDFSNVLRNPTSIIKTAVAGGVNLDSKIQIYAPMFDYFEYGVTNLAQFPVNISI